MSDTICNNDALLKEGAQVQYESLRQDTNRENKGHNTTEASMGISGSSSVTITDPSSPQQHLKNEVGFSRLDMWDQWDACVASAYQPDPTIVAVFFLGLFTTLFNLGVIYILLEHGGKLCSNGATRYWWLNNIDVVVTVTISWLGVSAFIGTDGMYANPIFGYHGCFRPWQCGTIREPFWGLHRIVGLKRNFFDGPLLASFYCGSRMFIVMSAISSGVTAAALENGIGVTNAVAAPPVSPYAVWCGFTSSMLLLVFDYGSYVGSSGMYHMPLSFYLLVKYGHIGVDDGNGVASANGICVLHLWLVILYVGCGLGKMGPWFNQVFNQEWTLPPWACLVNLKRALYKHGNDCSRDNTTSKVSRYLALLAATSEWGAGIMLMLTPSVVKTVMGETIGASFFVPRFQQLYGDNTRTNADSPTLIEISVPVLLAVTTIIAMHIYIIMHMPMVDVWILNILPGCLSLYAFYAAPSLGGLPECGFDYTGFANLPAAVQALCCCFIAFCIFGHCRTDVVSYTNCYRFWAGNWPHGWFIINKSGMDRFRKYFGSREWSFPGMPSPTDGGSPALAVAGAWEQESFNYRFLGSFQNAQPNHRVMPKLFVTVMDERHDGMNFTDFVQSGGRFYHPMNLAQSLMGLTGNCTLRAFYLLHALQEICHFEEGEVTLLSVYSFGSHQALDWDAKTRWEIIDAKQGLTDSGYISVNECLAITKPSVWKNRELESASNFDRNRPVRKKEGIYRGLSLLRRDFLGDGVNQKDD